MADPASIHFRILEDIAKNLRGEVAFPTSFDAAVMVRTALRKPGTTIDQMSRIVALEPFVVCKLLGLANAPTWNPDGKPVTSIPAAVERLGLEAARELALTVATDQIMRSKKLAAFDQFSQLAWNHSLQTAALARILARDGGRIDPEEAFLAGLIHDLGMFYLLSCASDYGTYLDNPDAIVELVIGWHESIGETVLYLLGVPERIITAVRDHDALRQSSGPQSFSDVVYWANLLAGGRFEWLSVTLTPPECAAIEAARETHASALTEAEYALRVLRMAAS